jgi:hypothetical protein
MPLSLRRAASSRILATWIVVAATGCAGGAMSGNRDTLPARPASDVPARFEPRDAAMRLVPGDTLAGPGCLSPMVDPRDRTEIRFISSKWYGDYEVPSGRYGARPGEVLRLECNTGRVIGLVPR